MVGEHVGMPWDNRPAHLPRTFQSEFDPRINALNLVRLVMAVGVMVWHSFPITGEEIHFAPLRQFLGEVWVDGFFAVSGFLIVRSWTRRPDARVYLAMRVLRIVPGYWVCLVVTSFVIAPVAILIQGGSPLSLVGGAVEYVVKNAALWTFQFGIAGTPTGVPFPDVWNGSIWTLGWEFICYLGVLALGVAGLLARWWTLSLAFIAAWGVGVATLAMSVGGLIEIAGRFALMFLAGALLFQFRGTVRLSWPLIGAAALCVAGAMMLPDYRLVGALPLAYVVLGVGILIRHPRLHLRNDVSYGTYIYAFPIQQLLVVAVPGIVAAVLAPLAVISTLVVAAASWFVIEKPAQQLRRFVAAPSDTVPKPTAL